MKEFSISILLGLHFTILLGQAPSIEWQRCIGGSDGEDAISILQTADSGYAVLGIGSSFDGDGIGTNGFGDYWLVRLNQDGSIRWSTIYGGSESDIPCCLIKKQDGGFLIAGTILSNDGDVIFNHGYYDVWIISLNDIGEIEWQKSLGGSSFDYAYSVQQTLDGGFIVVGSSESLGGDVSNHHGPVGHEPDFWVVKLNNIGDIEWEHSFGGLEAEEATSVIQMSDGGYVIAGYTSSNDGDVSGLHGMVGFYSDFWVIRLDSLGNLIWQKCLGGTGDEIAFALTKTTAEKILITGIAHSSDGDVTWQHPGDEIWVIQLDTNGEIDWAQTYGGDNDDMGYGIIKNNENDYYIIGTTKSYDAVTNWHGYIDYWLLNIDSIGNIKSESCYGGSEQEGSPYFLDLIDLQKTIDGGLIFAGSTQSDDGDVSGLHNEVGLGSDFWIVKLCSPENEIWYYADADSDGFGNSEIALKSCVIQEGYVLDSTDCDDSNIEIHPGSTEVLNGIDDNCDGWIDDGLSVDESNPFSIKIFPNPTSGIITINLPKTMVFDVSVRTLENKLVSFYPNIDHDQFLLDLSLFSPGIYIISIQHEDGIQIFQLMKE